MKCGCKCGCESEASINKLPFCYSCDVLMQYGAQFPEQHPERHGWSEAAREEQRQLVAKWEAEKARR